MEEQRPVFPIFPFPWPDTIDIPAAPPPLIPVQITPEPVKESVQPALKTTPVKITPPKPVLKVTPKKVAAAAPAGEAVAAEAAPQTAPQPKNNQTRLTIIIMGIVIALLLAVICTSLLFLSRQPSAIYVQNSQGAAPSQQVSNGSMVAPSSLALLLEDPKMEEFAEIVQTVSDSINNDLDSHTVYLRTSTARQKLENFGFDESGRIGKEVVLQFYSALLYYESDDYNSFIHAAQRTLDNLRALAEEANYSGEVVPKVVNALLSLGLE